MFRGAADMLAHDLPLAFAGVADAALQADLKPRPPARADARSTSYATELEIEVLPHGERHVRRSARRTSRRDIAPKS